MAVYRTTDTELTSIANAIRAKTGGSSSLVYPTGFVNAINSILTSGGSASSNNLILKDANGDTTSTSAISSDITLGTKSITPTSSAQIITPETGLDGYHTINVGAIPAYNYIGEDVEFLQNLYEEEISLSNTNFSNWTPSTSSAEILGTTTLNSITLSSSYDYILKGYFHVKYVYTQTPTNPAYTNYYNIGFIPIGPRPSGINDLENGTFNYVTYASGFQNIVGIYYNNNGVQGLTGNNYGIYAGLTSPSFSNQYQANFVLYPKTHNVRAVANNNYMHSSSFGLLDTTNTKIYMKLDLYRVNSNNDIWHGSWLDLINLHNTRGTTT